MDKNKSLRKAHIEAWKRYMDDSYTCDDLALILDLIKDDANIKEFEEVWDNVLWNKANDLPLTPEERKEIYRKEFAQLLAEYQNRQEMQKAQTIQPPSRNNTYRFRKIWYAAAAAAIILGFVIPATYLYMKPKTEQTVRYVETFTQRGEIKTVVLPDQTEVTLNAGSYLKYPENFTGVERSVELYGEALFDVTSDPARPFTVKTENMNIKVVGTVFNVKEYADDLTASVSVASGKVEVCLANVKALLEQNQQVKMDKITGNSETVNINAGVFLSWTKGTLYFYRTPIHEVVNMLNRHFPQVNIELVEGEYFYLITGEHENVNLPEDVISGIVYATGLKYKKTGNKYTLYKN